MKPLAKPGMSLTATASGGSAAWFKTTHWSVIWNAKNRGSATSQEALEQLCHSYWPPLYAYLRRKGYKREDAQDLTQEFVRQFLEKEWLNHLQHQDGKFRSFLLTFLENFLSDQHDRATAQKRGGGKQIISIDAFAAEERDFIGPVDGLTAEQMYERRWADAIMMQAAELLRAMYVKDGNLALFDQLKDLQPRKHGERSYAQIGSVLGISEQAVKNAVGRFRQRYQKALHDVVSQTVMRREEVTEELAHLLRIYSK